MKSTLLRYLTWNSINHRSLYIDLLFHVSFTIYVFLPKRGGLYLRQEPLRGWKAGFPGLTMIRSTGELLSEYRMIIEFGETGGFIRSCCQLNTGFSSPLAVSSQ